MEYCIGGLDGQGVRVALIASVHISQDRTESHDLT